MANYTPMLRRAIDAIDDPTLEARRELYAKARVALAEQLNAIKPPLPARDITWHKEDLERQIAELETSLTTMTTAARERNSRSAPRPTPSKTGGEPPRTEDPRSAVYSSVPESERREPIFDFPQPRDTAFWSTSGGYYVRPLVFKIPKQGVDPDYISVMMPFAEEFDVVFDAISSAGDQAGFRTQRADQVWEDQVIVEDVFSMIFRSAVVVCDFSGRNPNVMYEAGLAHALGRTVVPIAQNLNDLPFDIRHHRALGCEVSQIGLEKLRTKLGSRLAQLAPVPKRTQR